MVVALIVGACAVLAVPPAVRLPPPTDGPARRRAAATRGRRALAVGVLTGTGFLLLDPGLWWLSLTAAVLAAVAARRRTPGSTAATRTADRQLIAMFCELLASCLNAGMALAPALLAVSDSLTASDSASMSQRRSRGPVGGASGRAAVSGAADKRIGRRGAGSGPVFNRAGPVQSLDSVAAMLGLGADPTTAWRVVQGDEDLAPIAAAACRSSTGGGALAEALREHASQLRQQTAAADLRSAGRAGVLMTAPLGVCFLPAFLCLGLAPVVVGLLGQLDIF